MGSLTLFGFSVCGPFSFCQEPFQSLNGRLLDAVQAGLVFEGLTSCHFLNDGGWHCGSICGGTLWCWGGDAVSFTVALWRVFHLWIFHQLYRHSKMLKVQLQPCRNSGRTWFHPWTIPVFVLDGCTWSLVFIDSLRAEDRKWWSPKKQGSELNFALLRSGDV